MENISSYSIKLAYDIYNKLIDQKSKDIFKNRVLYSVTKDKNFITDILKLESNWSLLFDDTKNRKKLIFGAGKYGKKLINQFAEVKWECFIDNYVKSEEIEGLKVIDFSEFCEKYFDELVVISSVDYHEEIYEQLIKAGVDSNNILNIGKYCRELVQKQYFEMPYKDVKVESFVDIGCYDGYTSKEFVKWCKNNYADIWAFEPDPINYNKCIDSLKLEKCKLYNKGVFNKKGNIKFNARHTMGSKIEEDGEIEIEIDKLDDLLNDKKVTFIKMDIEGAELGALQGAEQIIRKQKPRLAISVYHNAEDIISIPNLLLQYNKDYKFKLRHYSCCEHDTVLYAF